MDLLRDRPHPRRPHPDFLEDDMTATLTAPAAGTRTDRVRMLLRVDAALCAGTGLLAAVAAAPVADLLGPDVPTGVVRVVGIALVAYALDLLLVSRAAARWQRPMALAAGVGNVVWELVTVLLVALGAFSVLGAVVALAVAAVVGGLGVLQLRAARR